MTRISQHLAIVLAMTFVTELATAAPFQNGGFETPLLPGGDRQHVKVPGWDLTKAPSSLVYSTAYIGLAPIEGRQMLAISHEDGYLGESVSQTFDTIAGTPYRVWFNAGWTGNPSSKDLQVLASVNSSASQLLGSTNLHLPAKATWGTATFTFVARTASSTLTLKDNSSIAYQTGIFLDAVSVAQALAIITQPEPQLVPLGGTAAFTVVAEGESPLRYQWLFNDKPISGATETNYIIHGVQAADAGSYSVVVSNGAGSATSASAALTLQVPHAATATATVVNGFVVGAHITDPGFGYTNTPPVRILGGGGNGAEALAVVSNGEVTAINILNPGKNYTDTPDIVIAPPFIPQPTMSIVALSLLSFTNVSVGTNYQLEYIYGSLLSSVGTPFIATSSTFTQMVSGTAAPSSYRLTPTPAPAQALAVAQVVNGFVVGATVTTGGSGYTTNPMVTIIGEGINATAIATVSGGSVTGITISNPGIGYTNTPSIIIALPPATSLPLGSVTQVMKVDVDKLSPHDIYQLEFIPAVAGGWSPLNTTFTPTSATSTQYINVSGDSGFFRVRYAP